MKCGYVVYRCRMCNEVTQRYELTVWASLMNQEFPEISYHRCKPNPLDLEFPANAVKGGVLDLIGVIEDENATM